MLFEFAFGFFLNAKQSHHWYPYPSDVQDKYVNWIVFVRNRIADDVLYCQVLFTGHRREPHFACSQQQYLDLRVVSEGVLEVVDR